MAMCRRGDGARGRPCHREDPMSEKETEAGAAPPEGGVEKTKPRRRIAPAGKKAAMAAAAAVAVAAAGVAVARRRRQSKQRTVYHVMPGNDRWEVRGEGAQRATSVHETKREAVASARQLAHSRQPSQLVVHRLDGTVQDSFVYG
jgi:hypothetical protein